MIRVQDLKKFFGPKKAVNGVLFTVEKGDVSVGGFDVVEEPLQVNS